MRENEIDPNFVASLRSPSPATLTESHGTEQTHRSLSQQTHPLLPLSFSLSPLQNAGEEGCDASLHERRRRRRVETRVEKRERERRKGERNQREKKKKQKSGGGKIPVSLSLSFRSVFLFLLPLLRPSVTRRRANGEGGSKSDRTHETKDRKEKEHTPPPLLLPRKTKAVARFASFRLIPRAKVLLCDIAVRARDVVEDPCLPSSSSSYSRLRRRREKFLQQA